MAYFKFRTPSIETMFWQMA